jgi:hypothetical protein
MGLNGFAKTGNRLRINKERNLKTFFIGRAS